MAAMAVRKNLEVALPKGFAILREAGENQTSLTAKAVSSNVVKVNCSTECIHVYTCTVHAIYSY